MSKLRHILISLLCLTTVQLHAEDTGGGDGGGTETLTEYLKNLGAYLGFDITQEVTTGPLATLIDASTATLTQQYAFISFLGAVPVNAYSDALANFVPSSDNQINNMANYTFKEQPGSSSYSSTGTGDQGGISVSALMDQETYQNDPLSQLALNILTTPQTTYCLNNDGTAYVDCDYLYDTKVMTNIVGPLPEKATDYFSFDYNQSIMTQLNGNTLLGPLLYNTQDSASSTSSEGSSGSGDGSDQLVAKSQAQEAHNFIRYAMKLVTPLALPQKQEYENLYSKATSSDDSVSDFDKQSAQEKLAKYMLKLRSYAAQKSIPTGNLYAILSKRMPQGQDSDTSQQTSQALSEFQMATRRLYDPSKQNDASAKQWLDQINEASTATIQKEIAILLAEMNYQLYLSRQQDERILAVLSLMAVQGLDEPSFSNEATIDTQPESSS